MGGKWKSKGLIWSTSRHISYHLNDLNCYKSRCRCGIIDEKWPEGPTGPAITNDEDEAFLVLLCTSSQWTFRTFQKKKDSSYIYVYIYGCFQKYGKTPKSSILIGFSIINHPFWETPKILETPRYENNSSFHNSWSVCVSSTCHMKPKRPDINDNADLALRGSPGPVETAVSAVPCCRVSALKIRGYKVYLRMDLSQPMTWWCVHHQNGHILFWKPGS